MARVPQPLRQPRRAAACPTQRPRQIAPRRRLQLALQRVRRTRIHRRQRLPTAAHSRRVRSSSSAANAAYLPRNASTTASRAMPTMLHTIAGTGPYRIGYFAGLFHASRDGHRPGRAAGRAAEVGRAAPRGGGRRAGAGRRRRATFGPGRIRGANRTPAPTPTSRRNCTSRCADARPSTPSRRRAENARLTAAPVAVNAPGTSAHARRPVPSARPAAASIGGAPCPPRQPNGTASRR